MKKQILLFIVIFFASIYSFSQNLMPSIFSIQGGIDRSNSVVIEWTIGENFTETVKSANTIITQGFHQPHLKILNVTNESILAFNQIKIYPNPVYSSLSIQFQNDLPTNYDIDLFDGNGKFIKKMSVPVRISSIEFDLSDLSSGMYLLKITSKLRSVSNTYRIIKY